MKVENYRLSDRKHNEPFLSSFKTAIKSVANKGGHKRVVELGQYYIYNPDWILNHDRLKLTDVICTKQNPRVTDNQIQIITIITDTSSVSEILYKFVQ